MAIEYPFKQLIGGDWVDASNGGTWDLVNPGTEEIVCKVPFGNAEDCRNAIEAAERAFSAWSSTTPYDRAAVLARAANLIRERVEDIWQWNSAESGKTVADAKGDLLAGAALFEWFAEEGKRAYGRTIPSRRAGKRLTVLHQPVGVVGVITAWNFPAYNPCRSIGAALAAGCTVVARPSEYTPLTLMIVARILQEAGLPPGVLNVISGEPGPMGQEMLDNPACRKIAFTGSVRVGKLLMDGASRTVTRLSLELGGNAPVLVFPDADWDLVAKNAVAAKYRNVGQVCISPQRFFIHEKARDRFLETVVPQVEKLKVGVGARPETEVGPLINATQRDRVEAIVAQSAKEGVSVDAGGSRPDGIDRGYFYRPTVLSNVTADSSAFTSEIFGPVMPVISFGDMEEAVALANRTPYGLAAYVFTQNLKTAIHTSEKLEFGLIAVNDWGASHVEGPFPGWKQSGIGAESGMEGLYEYLETKLVGIGGL